MDLYQQRGGGVSGAERTRLPFDPDEMFSLVTLVKSPPHEGQGSFRGLYGLVRLEFSVKPTDRQEEMSFLSSDVDGQLSPD